MRREGVRRGYANRVCVTDLSAERRLVKSPPELWAEISDPEALAKHLGEFGEIRITKVEPEHTVVWEGDLASGVARIESSGWGTKVVLTAEIPEPEPEIPSSREARAGAETRVRQPQPETRSRSPWRSPSRVAEPEPPPSPSWGSPAGAGAAEPPIAAAGRSATTSA